MMENNYIRYFFFSKDQQEIDRNIAEQLRRKFVSKKVLVTGNWIEYTEITSSSKPTRSDAILITSGDIRNIKYTK